MHKYFFLNLWLLGLIFTFNGFSQTIPPQFIEYVNETFNRRVYMEKYRVEPQSGYQLQQRATGNYTLSITTMDSARQTFFTVDSFMLGDFVMFFELNLTDNHDCPSSMDLRFAEREGNFYQISLKNRSDAMEMSLKIIQDTSITSIEKIEIDNFFLQDDPWTSFGISRNIIDGSIDIYLHKSKTPIMEIKNRQLILGGIKIIARECSVKIDNLKIYAPTVVKEYL